MLSQIQTESTIIVGAGQAASEAAVSLRQKGYGGRLLMLGEEAHPPYQRPPLSKTYLSGEVEQQGLYLKPATAYEKLSIEIRTGVRVTRLDARAQRITLSDGTVVRYNK